MSILSGWLNRSIKLTDGQFWSTFFGTDTWAKKSVTVDSALTVSAFWACVRLVSSVVGAMPLGLFLKNLDGGRDPQKGALAIALHDQPNADQTASEFWEGMVAQLLIWGNAFAPKIMSETEGVVGLNPPLLAGMVRVERDKTTRRLKYTYTENGTTRTWDEDQMFHIRGFGLGGDVGLSPLGYARQTLSVSMATDESAAKMFSNGMRPGGFFSVDKTLTTDQRDQAKKVLIDPYVGSENAYKIGILEAGFKWQDVVMPPGDAQMLESRRFHIEDVCRWLGVPPILIGHSSEGQTMWGSGIEQIVLGWLTLGLSPYLKRVEQSVKRSLLSDAQKAKGIYAEFNVDYLLRADSAARSALYSVLAQNGIMTRNEIRSKENLPKMDGGDVLTIQVNLQDLAKLGQTQPAAVAAARAALLSILTGDEDTKERPKLELVK